MTPESSYLSRNRPDEAKGLKNAYPFQSHNLLHSVRKSQAKPWKKAPVAPPPPTHVKVYKVDALNFRDLVQQLTGAPEVKHQLHHQLLQSVAPSSTSNIVATPQNPILLSRDIAAASSTVSTNWYQGAKSEALEVKSRDTTSEAKPPGLLELNLSSSSSYYN
ncbi:uncharacterized protein LOC133285674 [Gastrolobium bilobum]|uniref:uncharacterized protein LOC133285674 n=1 Tax=Gastrolobium bilobum TaxID=150636 RepID=UPI002AB28BCF|nr:uncharacterized protein LOC133285674 [Gastrolobium bilobum]